MVNLIIFVVWKTWVRPIRAAKVAVTQLSPRTCNSHLADWIIWCGLLKVWGCSCCVGKYQSTLILRNTPYAFILYNFWFLAVGHTTLPSISKNSSQDVFGQFSRQLHCKVLLFLISVRDLEAPDPKSVILNFSTTWNGQILFESQGKFCWLGYMFPFIYCMDQKNEKRYSFKKPDIPIPIIQMDKRNCRWCRRVVLIAWRYTTFDESLRIQTPP